LTANLTKEEWKRYLPGEEYRKTLSKPPIVSLPSAFLIAWHQTQSGSCFSTDDINASFIPM
jgi:hypothetical protein